MQDLGLVKEPLPQDDVELQRLVEKISQRDFRLPFRHQSRFNTRLRTSGGRYLLSTHNLEFNPRHGQVYGVDELIGAIRHELCHYHLHLAGLGYRHRDAAFQKLLARVGGARYARALDIRPPAAGPFHVYVCTVCQHRFVRKRRVDVSRYVCGACKGVLTHAGFIERGDTLS